MNNIHNTFDEYVLLRLNGLESSEAINVLQAHIQKLDDELRNELSMLIRSWEAKKTKKISSEDRARLVKAGQDMANAHKVICRNCNKYNPETEVICNFCGYLLKKHSRTDTLPTSDESMNDAIFPYDGVLILLGEQETSYILHPQFSLSRLTIGRSSDDSTVDIDLNDLGGNESGVSRLHATITYNESSQTLSILDMDSTNGSFVNEQRLHPNENRVIRHGDRLRFGRISLKVVYKHKSS